MRRLIAVYFLLACITSYGQYNPLSPPSTFQHFDNPHYWKNKKPHSAYWQQDVAYTINARLDDVNDLIEGDLELVYTNNSPDTLRQLVFHLYQNAFDSGSYASQYHGEHPPKGFDNYQNIQTSEWTVNDMDVVTEMDNTILFVDLNDVLLPGERINIACRFTTKFGDINGRMKMYESWGFKHYNVVHWYPRISVYDQKFGWTTDQHLGNEFYGDFGSFNVTLDLPNDYVLDGTGFLMNRTEVLPPALMEKLAIENYKDKPWNEKPSVVIPRTDELKKWRFHAENVHDFAWTADPTYRIGKSIAKLSDGREVVCYALAQEPHAAGWQNAADYAAAVIKLFSDDFGSYDYHKMIVADARDGMEYPMLTLDGGSDPNYRSLFAHEIGHNWFFGMLGNNETYQAALDEGFTQFLTAWAMGALESDTVDLGTSVLGVEKPFKEYRTQRDLSVYDGYYFSVVLRNEHPSLNTHSDHFDSGRAYGQVYSKTATMLYNLQYVLGDELFLKAMKHYVKEWKYCHPYFEDFRRSIIQYTNVDLNWFFDQWLEQNETIDYGIKKVKRHGLNYEVTLKRKGMQMPLDLRAVDKEGKLYNFYIPNTYFEKETEAKVFPKWYGWKKFNSEYTATFTLDKPLHSITIDPSRRLADVYQLDNTKSTPVNFEVNDFQWTRPVQAYEIEWNPILWYNSFDGLKGGLQFKGSYANVYHKLNFKLWYNSSLFSNNLLELRTIDLINYALSYEDPLRGISNGLSYKFSSKWLDGLVANKFEINKDLPNKKTKLSYAVEGLYRFGSNSWGYLIYPSDWNVEEWNNFNEVSLVHTYNYANSSKGTINAVVRSPFVWSDYSYGFLQLDARNENRFWNLNWKTRLFGQWGLGENWAPESSLSATGANNEDLMDNPITRSVGIIPTNWYGYGTGTGNFQMGGGLNLRGYNNYLLPEFNADSLLRFAAFGQSGLAFNTELEFDDLLPVLSSYRAFAEIKTYLFADAGIININRTGEPLAWSSLRMDAGLGTCLMIKRWGKYSELKPLNIRFDMPMFLNRPPAGEEYLAFRWLLGIERAF